MNYLFAPWRSEYTQDAGHTKTEQITELLTLLSNSDITFEELMRHMRTDAVEVMEKIEY